VENDNGNEIVIYENDPGNEENTDLDTNSL
jgi:hypothetical protein